MLYVVAPALSAGDVKLVSLGTVEPRKNYRAAAAIVAALDRMLPGGAELHIAGREGWGDDIEHLKSAPAVRLHGYLPVAGVKALAESADLYLCTSHDEGLGLPLLEAQYAGLPVVAPDGTVFREVLGGSGTFIDASRPEAAAQAIVGLVSAEGWRAATTQAALANVARWNAVAACDARWVRGMFRHPVADSMARRGGRAA